MEHASEAVTFANGAASHPAYLHGEPADYRMIGAEAHVGSIVVELLQPDEGLQPEAGTAVPTRGLMRLPATQ